MTAPDWPLGWVLQLQHAATREQAGEIAQQALADGADPATVAALLVEWGLLYEASTVQWVAS